MSRVLATLVLFAAACSTSESKPLADVPTEDEVWLTPQQMEKANIHVAEAAEREIPDSILVGGHVAFDDLRVTHVFSPVTGRVMKVLAKPGQRVKQGAPLVSIVSPDVGAAFSNVLKAQADLQSSEADFHRESRLFDEQATSARAREAAEDTFHKAKAEYDRAKQRASMLAGGSVDAVTQEYTLRSYIDGEVIARSVNVGTEVVGQYTGGNSNELFTIGDIKRVWVFADVPDRDLPRVKVGADVDITVVAYPDRVFHGKVDYISNTVNPTVRTAQVRCVLANETEELKPEMFATIQILQPPRRRLAVPHDATVRINEQSFVFVAAGTRADGRLIFKRRQVTTGEARGGFVAIREGLSPGERVVTEGSVSRDQPNDEIWPSPKQVEQAHITTTVATTLDVPDAVTIGGRITFDDARISHVFSPVTGRITRVLAQLGQRVARGAPLVAISSPDLGNFLADTAKAKADLTQADHEYQRQQELFAAGAGSQHDLDLAKDNFERAKAEFDRAQRLTQLLGSSSIDAVSQEYILRSPIAGEVIARAAHPGQEIQGQYSNGSNVLELFTIGEVDRLWVIGDLYEIDLPRVTEGNEATIKVADKTFHGTVDWVADVLDPTLHTAKVRCLIDNPDHLLRPEMYESVDIRVPHQQFLAVPRSALMRVEGETIAFVQTGEHRPDGAIVFKRRKVQANIESASTLVPVLSGLRPGERVATDHALMLLGML